MELIGNHCIIYFHVRPTHYNARRLYQQPIIADPDITPTQRVF